MKNLKFLLALGVLVLTPLIANAEENKVTFSCPDVALPGEKISCKIGVSSSNVTFGGMTAKYNLGNGVTYDSIYTTYSYPVNTNSATGFALGDTSGFKNNEIATVKFKLPRDASSNQSYTISLTDISLSDTEYIDYDFDSITEIVRVKSNNNNLSMLSVTGANFTFDEATKKYDLTIDNEKITITATTVDKKATVVGAGEKILKYGLNVFEVTVTSETGMTNVYTLNITRPDNRDTSKELLEFIEAPTKFDTKKDKSLTFRIDKEFNLLDKVYVDGKEVDKKMYEAKSGSTVITFNDEYTKTLKDGEHTFKTTFTDGSAAETKFTIENSTVGQTVSNPETGLFIGVGTVGLIGLVSVGLYFILKNKNVFPKA